jgi:hypothetical protein
MKTQGISALRHNPADALMGSDPSPASVKLRMRSQESAGKKSKLGTIESIRNVATPAAAAFQKAGRFSVGIRGFIWKKALSQCVVR